MVAGFLAGRAAADGHAGFGGVCPRTQRTGGRDVQGDCPPRYRAIRSLIAYIGESGRVADPARIVRSLAGSRFRGRRIGHGGPGAGGR